MFSETKSISLSELKHSANMKDGYEIMLSGQKTGFFVPFQVLEAAVTIDSERILLFLTDDTPYEEVLNISLVHMSKGILETVSLGGAYLTGTFSEFHVLPNAVEFSFIGDTTWRIEVADQPFLKIPFVGDPRGISRTMGLTHYLRVSANPAPAKADGRR
ncbi:hypothetical protein [Serratia sp. CY85251]|uniref:hypothetical protein n=1 Tax=Serratia sp. CY85251 TaxID=3383696 RepID=UPI003F9EC06C